MLTDQELASMRDTVEAWLPGACTIQTGTDGVDALGAPTTTYANTYTSVPCRVDPAGEGSEAVRSFALEGVSAWILNIPYDQAISIKMRVVYGGVTYQVRGVIDNQSFNLNRQAVIVRIN